MIPFYSLAIGILVTWRMTHLVSNENGPWNVLEKLRRWAGPRMLGELLVCFYCLSLWIAAPLAALLGSNWRDRLMLWPTISAGAILLERLTLRGEDAVPIVLEQPEDTHVLRS